MPQRRAGARGEARAARAGGASGGRSSRSKRACTAITRSPHPTHTLPQLVTPRPHFHHTLLHLCCTSLTHFVTHLSHPLPAPACLPRARAFACVADDFGRPRMARLQGFEQQGHVFTSLMTKVHLNAGAPTLLWKRAHFYNNFEISHLALWRSEPYRRVRFFSFLLSSLLPRGQFALR